MTKKIKIALVHDSFTQWGGAERVLKTFSEIFPEAPIYVLVKDQQVVHKFLPGKMVIPSFLQNYPGMPSKLKYYFYLMPKAAESFDFSCYDIVLSDSSAFSKGVKTSKKTKHICYMHTPTRYLTSDEQQYFADAKIPLPIIGRPIVRALLNKLKKWDFKASKRPDVLIANSKFIATKIKKYYKRDVDAVIFPPVDTAKFKISSKIEDYFLVVARLEPYKSTELAIRAANKLGINLKIIGEGSDKERLQKIAGPTVKFLGSLYDKEIADIYSKAQALIFPQIEDAGLTPLESMASGRPVIAFAKGGALESVINRKTGILFNEQSEESLIEAIHKFKNTNFDPKFIRNHAKKFDIAKFKQKISEIVAKNS
ncbi:glycosyltransferase [Candidatus Berkelbacteria bacterium]|nr:glycosyltransferase [Candidatus Berkelbacteria bacterium]